MEKARKTQRRVDFINALVETMSGTHSLQEGVSRKGDEAGIQKAVFSYLNNEKLEVLISDKLNMGASKAKKIVKNNFKYEDKTTESVNNFHAFSVNHRPDAELNADNFRMAFEIKKGNSGDAIRAGIGQSMIYSLHFDFVIYFFVDTKEGRDIRDNMGPREEGLISDLWNDRNIKFKVV